MEESVIPSVPIIFEDDVLLVVNKPAGMTVNRSETTTHEQTLQDWVEQELGRRNEESGIDKESDFYQRAGIVHRIDKETSGILLIAKTPEAFANLQAQFKERRVKKSYIALAHGKLAPATGEINVPVGRLPWNRRQFGIVAGGRESVTFYTAEKYFRTPDKRRELLTLLRLNPITGRTHQIRVHLQYLGHPIFSDFLYAGRKTQREDRKLLARVFLHAATISFFHPVTREQLSLSAPLPPELQQVLDLLVPVVY
jgi:23S rRNA pseudouridine1911/1915/1917 synthase